MASTPDLQAIARQMKTAQDETQQIAPITSQAGNFDVPAAYAVAKMIHEARLKEGAVPVGRKIGFTNPEMWSLYGVQEPIWAFIYKTTVAQLSEAHGSCSIGRFAEPKIEPEIVFHFRSAPSTTSDLDEILTCIDWVAPAFEIVQSHFPGWKFQAADTVADWSLHGTLLLGEARPVERLGDDPVAALEHFSVTLSCNGQVREIGKGANVLGNPLAAIAHLIDVLAKQPQFPPIQPGEIISTGTLTTAQPIHAGETWQARLDGIALAGLAVSITP